MTIVTLRRPLGAAGAVSTGGENSAAGLIRRWRHTIAPLDRALAPTAHAA
jgi:hypothetical protein